MRDPKRIDKLTERLEAVWKEHPDLRLAQLISNVFVVHYPYYMEDEEFITLIEEFYKEIKRND